MTLVLRAKNAAFSKYYSALFYPVFDNLTGLYLFGSSGGGVSNLAGGAALTPIGSPTINQYSFVGGRTAGYDTGLAETADFTFVGVAKRISGAATIVSNLNNLAADADIGATLGQSANTVALVALNVNATNGIAVTSAGAPVDTPTFFAGRCSGNTIKVFFGYNGSLTSNSFTGGSRSLDSVETLKIAAHNYSGIYLNNTEIYMAAIHSAALTDAQVTSVYTSLRQYYAGRGISTL